MRYWVVHGTVAVEVTWEDYLRAWGGPDARHELVGYARTEPVLHVPLTDSEPDDSSGDEGGA